MDLVTESRWQIWTKANNRQHETGRSSQSAFIIHIVAYVAHNRTDVLTGSHISYLCNRRHCFNPAHLVRESVQSNNSHKGCPGCITCSVHDHVIIDLCLHNPRCIRPPCDDVHCCLVMKEKDPLPLGLGKLEK